MPDSEVFACFTGMMLHDLGKTVLDSEGKWRNHQKLDPSLGAAYSRGDPVTDSDIDHFLGSEAAMKARQHEWKVIPDRDAPTASMAIADRLQKAMYQMQLSSGDSISMLEEGYGGNLPQVYGQRLFPFPAFFPFYGNEKEAWQPKDAWKLLKESLKALEQASGRPAMKHLLAAERPLRQYPHTTYIPYLSLELHHRFAATLFLLVHKELARLRADRKKNTEFRQFRFSVITALPDPLELYYRLRDVRIYDQAISDLRKHLYHDLFEAECLDVPGASAEYNPYEYYTGNGLVIVYDDRKSVLEGLKRAIQKNETLRLLSISGHDYTIPIPWTEKDRMGMIPPEDIHTETWFATMVDDSLVQFPSQSLSRCARCNLPMRENQPGDHCPECRQLLDQPGLLDLEMVAQDSENQPSQLAYVFVTLPGDLPSHALEVAQDRIDRMLEVRSKRDPDERWKHAPKLLPTRLGLFEYLEAVLAVDSWQRDINASLNEKIYPIAEYPQLSIFVMPVEEFLGFFDMLDSKLSAMRLEVGVRVILCKVNTPIWSLMDRFTKHAGPDRLLIDSAGGEIVYFSDEDIKNIRKLAGFPHWVTTKNQLQSISNKARKSSLEELKLDIDIRRKKSKIRRDDFASILKASLENIPGTGILDREKRAKFIKNVADLGSFKTS